MPTVNAVRHAHHRDALKLFRHHGQPLALAVVLQNGRHLRLTATATAHLQQRRRADADAQAAAADGRDDAAAVLAAEDQAAAARVLLHRAAQTRLRVAREVVHLVQHHHYV